MNSANLLEIANVSDVGRKRPHNEDSTGSDAASGLVALANGMGGYRAGEIASAIAVTTIMHNIRQGLRTLGHDKRDDGSGLSRESRLLKKAITEANNSIFNTASDESACRGMGTTVVVGLFYQNRLSVAHVGDSRMYRLRNDELKQITTDHSLIQEQVARGLYNLEEASANTPKNLVTRALGLEPKVEIDLLEKTVLPEDIYLLCSDGLNDMVNDEEIRLALGRYIANLIQCAQELVRMANENGGKDNVSVILVREQEAAGKSSGFLQKLFGRTAKLWGT